MNFFPNIIKIHDIKSGETVSILNLKELHTYILTKVSIEFNELVKDCYYPKIAVLFKELLHRTQSTEKGLIEYSKNKYKFIPFSSKFKLLHDPYTTLLILIMQEFLKQKDVAGAETTFHLMTLRYYTNLLYRYTTSQGKNLCVPEYFRGAFSQLSKNHIFNRQKTISNSIIYFSRTLFTKYKTDVQADRSLMIFKMIHELRSRLNQSIQSFFHKYYEIAKNKGVISQEEEKQWDPTHETQIKEFIDRISKDICIYKKIDHGAIKHSVEVTKFNKRLADDYAKELSVPNYIDNINVALFLLLKEIKDTNVIKENQFLDYVKKLMSVKTSKQPIYFKKIITSIHDSVIIQLNLTQWYDHLSLQSKAISRNFVAYYLAFYLRGYV